MKHVYLQMNFISDFKIFGTKQENIISNYTYIYIANKHLYRIGNQIEDAKSIKTFFASFQNSQICISAIMRQIYYHFYFIVILLKMCFALAACKCIFTAVACMWHIKTNDLKQLKAHETNYVLIGGHFSSIALICNQNILC